MLSQQKDLLVLTCWTTLHQISPKSLAVERVSRWTQRVGKKETPRKQLSSGSRWTSGRKMIPSKSANWSHKDFFTSICNYSCRIKFRCQQVMTFSGNHGTKDAAMDDILSLKPHSLVTAKSLSPKPVETFTLSWTDFFGFETGNFQLSCWRIL